MKIVCLDADTLGKDADLSEFEKFGDFVKFDMTKKDETLQRVKDADIVITNKVVIDEEIMANSDIKLICISATGMNNVDLDAAQKRNIVVKNVAGYSTNSVVQQTFATLFELLNSISYYANYTSSGEWAKSDIFTHLNNPISEICGKEFGVIGLGTIGLKVAKIATAFGANVRYYSTSGKNVNDEFIGVSLDALLRTCDIISIHAPLNANTANLISQNELAKLKDGAILMNFGRGGIVDEIALAKAIDEKNLKVGLDVLEAEPMSQNNPLLNVKNKNNLVITPHIAWASVEARATLIKMVAKNIREFIEK